MDEARERPSRTLLKHDCDDSITPPIMELVGLSSPGDVYMEEDSEEAPPTAQGCWRVEETSGKYCVP